MATRGLTGISQTIGASEELIFESPVGQARITTLCVKCDSSSPASVVIRIPDLHGATGGLTIAPGEKEYFRVKDGELAAAYAAGNGAIIHWGGISTTRGH